MINSIMRIAALTVAATFSTGCEKRDCLAQSYDTTVKVVQDFNGGRCRVVLEGDHRAFECPSGLLAGEVNGRRFDLTLEAGGVQYQFTRERLDAQCGAQRAHLSDPDTLSALEGRFKRALAELEVD